MIWLVAQPVVALAMEEHGGGASSAEVAAALAAYIQGSRAGDALVARIPAGDALKVLNISRTWLTSILPHVLSKIHRVSFGLLHPEDEERWKVEEGVTGVLRMPPSRRLLAIPFVGKDVPSRSSEFAHPDVLIGSSIMAFRYNGLRRSDLFNVLNVLQVSMRGEPGPYSERPSHIIFEGELVF